MKKIQHYVVCYDISSDKGRRKIEKIVSHYGSRLQYSVFECMVSSTECREMLKRLNLVFKGDEFQANIDTVVIFTMCDACSGKMKTIGKSYVGKNNYLVL